MSLTPVFKIGIWNGWIFMCVFLLQIPAIMLSDRRIRKKTHVPDEARRNNIERYMGMMGNVIWFLALGYSVFLPLRLNTIWFFMGLTLFIVGTLFMAIATVNFITTSPDHVIKKGVYHISRHPMYLATILICLGTGIATVSWLFILICILMTLCFHQEALIEERVCLHQYGDIYQEYINRTPRWIGFTKKHDK
ncbi:isoprenylcysteine carboxylmethyltransferase family protein [bacterium]|nr:isoprenylcysteine carboxylmethyltransferase family protein [bacterium]